MMTLVDLDDDGLVVFPTHRIVRDLNSFNSDEVIANCADYFDITLLANEGEIKPFLDMKYADGKKAFVI